MGNYKVSDIIKITEIPAEIVGIKKHCLLFKNGDTITTIQYDLEPVKVNQYYE